jgi:hypothetical protein
MFEKAQDLLKKLLEPATVPPNGYRIVDGWIVVDGDAAAQFALSACTWPPEVTMCAQLAARYGAQIAVCSAGALLLLPEGTPSVVSRVAMATGYVETSQGDAVLDFQAWWWQYEDP